MTKTLTTSVLMPELDKSWQGVPVLHDLCNLPNFPVATAAVRWQSWELQLQMLWNGKWCAMANGVYIHCSGNRNN